MPDNFSPLTGRIIRPDFPNALLFDGVENIPVGKENRIGHLILKGNTPFDFLIFPDNGDFAEAAAGDKNSMSGLRPGKKTREQSQEKDDDIFHRYKCVEEGDWRPNAPSSA